MLFLTGMAVFAQGTDMSFYTEEYDRQEASVFSRLEILEEVRNSNLAGTGEFYHNALRGLISRLPGYRTRDERASADIAARIIVRGLVAEGYTEAIPELWILVQNFDVIRDFNDGLVMHDALIAMGQLGAKEFVPHIALRLNSFNTDLVSDAHSRSRIQQGVIGAITALETLQDPEGFRPVFFASIGWYDPSIRAMASIALPNILEDPSDLISELIRDHSNNPRIKYEAWREMMRTRAPNSSKAKVAAVALATGWTYTASNIDEQNFLRNMRLSAMDAIRHMGVEDSSVYGNLERSYKNNFISNVPDMEEIRRTLSTLSAIRTEE